jgi:hypothetical protein
MAHPEALETHPDVLGLILELWTVEAYYSTYKP